MSAFRKTFRSSRVSFALQRALQQGLRQLSISRRRNLSEHGKDRTRRANARVAKLADALDLGSCALNGVGVQLPPLAVFILLPWRGLEKGSGTNSAKHPPGYLAIGS